MTEIHLVLAIVHKLIFWVEPPDPNNLKDIPAVATASTVILQGMSYIRCDKSLAGKYNWKSVEIECKISCFIRSCKKKNSGISLSQPRLLC
jgi:hypothetical protein